MRADRPDTAVRRAHIEGVLQRAKRLYLQGDISDEEYEQERSKARRGLDELPPDDARVAIRSFDDLARSWPKASLAARRAFLEEVFERLVLGDDGSLEVVVRERSTAALSRQWPSRC